MGLFQKKPQTSTSAPLYSLGIKKTLLVVGLGNPGKEYELTRHNVGFMCIDGFVETLESANWTHKKDLKSLVAHTNIGDSRVIFIKPQTFMNLSGEAVAAVSHFYKIPTENMLVIYDDIDIPFGQIRLRQGGGSAGHNGVASILTHCDENFTRIRIGIQPENKAAETTNFVLSNFSKEEHQHLTNLKREVSAVLSEYIHANGELPHDTRTFFI